MKNLYHMGKQMGKTSSSHKLDLNLLSPDPLIQFEQWFNQAVALGIEEANAMTLATCNQAGQPSARIVLLKQVDNQGFVFFTNYLSRKGQDLTDNPLAALLFWWGKLEQQIRIEGHIEKLSPEESDHYFDTRPLESKIAAIISRQSQVINAKQDLITKYQSLLDQNSGNPAGEELKRPDYWGGYRLQPARLEFWQGGEHRLHDRVIYTLGENKKWERRLIAP